MTIFFLSVSDQLLQHLTFVCNCKSLKIYTASAFFYGTKEIFHAKISLKIPHTANTRSFRMCVIKEYRFYTISLRIYNGWCQYHKFMSMGSKTVQKRSRKVKNGQYGKKWSIWSKPDKNRSKKVLKNGQKR